MQKILLFGAGKSATVLIDYLLQLAVIEKWQLLIADSDLKIVQIKIGNSPHAKAISFDITDDVTRGNIIASADIVISLLPPALHFLVAKDCVAYSKNLLTGSYMDSPIKSLQNEIEKKGLFFLCEMGLDPGIDHMSAMQIINRIRENGGSITSFKSHCGGLVTPESNNNPWHYKISWNTRNIVLAGKAGATYMENGEKVELPYSKIFNQCSQLVVDGLPTLTWYPNRDSLSYASLYNLEKVSTFIRTTLRYNPFCLGWNVICHLGLTDTDDENKIDHLQTIQDWLYFKLSKMEMQQVSWKEYLKAYVATENHIAITEQFEFLDLFKNKPIPFGVKSSADILQHLLETKLLLEENDKDMVVMLHEIEYEIRNKKSIIKSILTVKGENSLRTAMAKTVGLPLGIAAKLILKKQIQLKGLYIPVVKEIYEPVLKELKLYNIIFSEKETPYM